MKPSQLVRSVWMLLLLFICSCSPLISLYDQTSYTQITSLKVDVLDLMNKATDDYSVHDADVKALQLKIDKAIEYDKHRPHNDVTNKMWALINDPSGNLFGGFITKWKKDRKESSVFLTDKEKQISDSFDQMAELESGKIKSTNSN